MGGDGLMLVGLMAVQDGLEVLGQSLYQDGRSNIGSSRCSATSLSLDGGDAGPGPGP